MDVQGIAQEVFYALLEDLTSDAVREELEWQDEDPSDENVEAVMDYVLDHAGLS